MIGRLAPAALVVASTLLGCATTPKPPPPPIPMTAPPGGERPSDAQPVGEVVWSDLSGVNPQRRASFDEWTVTGPRLSLRRTDDGRWVGKVSGRETSLATAPGKVSGPGVELTLSSDEKGGIVVDGLWGGRPVHILLEKNRISGSFPGGQLDLTEMGSGMFNSYQGLMQLTGPPDMPQVVLAILSVLAG